MRKKLKIFLWGILGLIGLWVGLQIFIAGQVRQARFNVDVLGQVIDAYFKTKGQYPSSLEKLSKFVVVSARDHLYCDNNYFKKRQHGGYSYDFNRIDSTHFVLSACPVGWMLGSPAFGLTEDGILRIKVSDVHFQTDSYMKVKGWKPIERLNRIVVQ